MGGFLSGRTSLTTVQTGDIANDAITEAKVATDAIGLTEIKAGTDGELISWDASGNPAAVAVGTATHVLTSNGAGAAPTFQAAAGGGAWTLIASTVISADATVTFTGIDATYDTHAFVISDLDVATDDKDLFMVVGDAGGLDTGASDYKWAGNSRGDDSNPDISGGDGGNPEIDLCLGQGAGGAGIGSAAGETYGGIVYLHTPSDGAGQPVITSNSAHHDNGGTIVWTSMAAVRAAVITLTQVQFKLESDATMTAGRISLFGIKHT